MSEYTLREEVRRQLMADEAEIVAVAAYAVGDAAIATAIAAAASISDAGAHYEARLDAYAAGRAAWDQSVAASLAAMQEN